ncbi:MAG: hypothetical protein ACRD1G_05340 [Acidimicrobiales bacterium]
MHFYGSHSVDVDGELAKLDADGYRPLRVLSTMPPSGGRGRRRRRGQEAVARSENLSGGLV